MSKDWSVMSYQIAEESLLFLKQHGIASVATSLLHSDVTVESLVSLS